MSSHLASVGLAAALAFHEGELGLAASEGASPRRRRSHHEAFGPEGATMQHHTNAPSPSLADALDRAYAAVPAKQLSTGAQELTTLRSKSEGKAAIGTAELLGAMIEAAQRALIRSDLLEGRHTDTAGILPGIDLATYAAAWSAVVPYRPGSTDLVRRWVASLPPAVVEMLLADLQLPPGPLGAALGRHLCSNTSAVAVSLPKLLRSPGDTSRPEHLFAALLGLAEFPERHVGAVCSAARLGGDDAWLPKLLSAVRPCSSGGVALRSVVATAGADMLDAVRTHPAVRHHTRPGTTGSGTPWTSAPPPPPPPPPAPTCDPGAIARQLAAELACEVAAELRPHTAWLCRVLQASRTEGADPVDVTVSALPDDVVAAVLQLLDPAPEQLARADLPLGPGCFRLVHELLGRWGRDDPPCGVPAALLLRCRRYLRAGTPGSETNEQFAWNASRLCAMHPDLLPGVMPPARPAAGTLVLDALTVIGRPIFARSWLQHSLFEEPTALPQSLLAAVLRQPPPVATLLRHCADVFACSSAAATAVAGVAEQEQVVWLAVEATRPGALDTLLQPESQSASTLVIFHPHIYP